MSERPILTTDVGAPIVDNQNTQSAGERGPLLIQDQHLLEKLARFNRERIPERIVHARGSGAYGVFEVTDDVTRYTKAKFLSEVGKRTEVFVRFSTVAGNLGAPDAVRDPRGFAVKFYTEDGNYDLVGNNTPIFFIQDPLKFPDFIHSQKRDPYTGMQEPDNIWDFFSLSPEATHMFTWLFGDRGIPASYRHMNGYGSHTFQWMNADGEAFWIKYHFKTDQGIRFLTNEEAAVVAGRDPDSHQRDLHTAIDRGDYPSWTLYVQIMPWEDAQRYRFNPFDLTKVWPHSDYPLIRVGRMTLNRNPDNVFADVEQSAFNPNNFVPGIGPSPDKMLQGRLFAYGDAHRYRLGVNYTQLPVNAPRAVAHGVNHYHRDGFMRFDGNHGRKKNYEPNSFDGPVETGEPFWKPFEVNGLTGTYETPRHPEDNDFVQAGLMWRKVLDEAARTRLVNNIAESLSKVSREDIIERSISHFRNADSEYGDRVEKAVKELRAHGGATESAAVTR
ncbi:catalase [Carbonactinospora thermoautotrophica]|uniref:Catalase n=1 Tax=Carbonactinospora thermoautotrophica TaxID=1469144 RepID=A0A132MYF9_9ACTN|nr:catalase [Carbonactinospora thermoautotrophica]KWX02909.1 Catalase [Carbonactinospora thermoautotrophica]MCX9192669.1 catalase [Carbonactinospora thermoautotrophica]